ncbi:protein YAE1 [Drosophila pseudoobscura]|uniref:Protein YAE1 n=1 Tax=Drosophila pseudoobscura pseudoobscura TaxID=46245 RepID=A0A6I8UPH4_DROPS|nr:protein YAE1 [Drosophila pseudoobscura]
MSQAAGSDEETDFKVVSSTNYQRVQEKVGKISYADGVADGREQVFQTSFDQGYADGLHVGLDLTKFGSFFDTLAAAGSRDDKLLKEKEAYKGLNLPKATDKQHFKYLDHQNEPLDVVSTKQGTYTDDLLDECAASLPITANLFISRGSSVNLV